MRHHLSLLSLLVLCASAASAQTTQYQFRATSQNRVEAGFRCGAPGCGMDVAWARIRGDFTVDGPLTAGSFSAPSLTSTGDVHGATLTADGAMTSSSVSTGSVGATDVSASTLTTTSLTSSSASVTGTTTTGALNVQGSISTPAFAADAQGNLTFTKPLTVTTSVCATSSSPTAISALNTGTPVASLTSPAFKVNLPCFVAPPVGLSANVDAYCRVTAAGAATVYVKSGLVGLQAAAGQWCAVVVGS